MNLKPLDTVDGKYEASKKKKKKIVEKLKKKKRSSFPVNCDTVL